MRLVRWAVLPALVVPVAWLLFTGLGRDPRALASPLIGQPAPAFALEGLDGRTVALDSYRGRAVIVNFWASWCFECIAEHQVLLDAQRRYGEDVAIIGILYQDAPNDALGFLARYGDGGWPNLIDADGRLAIEYGVTGVPESFFIDRSGIVRFKQYGAVTQPVVDGQLPPILVEPSPSGPARSQDAATGG
jgi:cytochrome c biogenesis protein CcmG/thiol:disulfide interchange protein DsbE